METILLKKCWTVLLLIICFVALTMPFSENTVRAAYPDINDLWYRFQREQSPPIIFDYYPYAECFKKASEIYGISPLLLLAVAKGESDFNSKAKSSANCHGIMQIKWPITAKELGFRSISELRDPCRNIMAGAKYLRQRLDQHGQNIHLALAAYNYGPGSIHSDISLGDVPAGARWYSGYIYHHMKTILNRARELRNGKKIKGYRRSRKLPIITFQYVFRAEAFIDYIREEIPSIRLDWFRTPENDYAVVMLFGNDSEKRKAIQKLASVVGYKVDESREF